MCYSQYTQYYKYDINTQFSVKSSKLIAILKKL